MLSSIQTSSNLKHILAKPQLNKEAEDKPSYFASSNPYSGCLTATEQLKLTEKLSHISDSNISKLWQSLLLTKSPGALRQFLDINKDWQGLFEAVNLKILNRIFASKETAALFCQLIHGEAGKVELLNKLTQFGEFIDSLEQHGINHADLANLASLSAKELHTFLVCFSSANDKKAQIKFANPVVEDSEKALCALASGHSFINQDILHTIPQVPAEVLYKPECLLNYIVNHSTNSSETIKHLGLLYISRCNLAKDNSLSLLDNLISTNKISVNTYIVAIKFTLALDDAKALSFIKNTICLIPDKFFNLVNPGDINENGLALLEQIQIIDEYLIKMQVSIDLGSCNDLTTALDLLENAKYLHIKALSHDRSLEDVVAEFSKNNPNLFKTLNDSQIELLKQQYLQIKAAEQEISGLSQVQVLELIREIKDTLNYAKTNSKKTQISVLHNPVQQDAGSKEHSTYLLMAIANRAFVQYFNIYPHHVQTLTVLAMLLPRTDFKGVLAQVRTGEGKSTIVTLFALVLACQGKCVDVITSTPYLAKRDEVKYKQFFNAFEISTSNLCDEDIRPENFTGQIIYGTNYSFEFSILFDKLYLSGNRVLYNNRYQPRPQQVAIVDEVDNMLVDKALNSARIAYSGDQSLTPIYPLIYDYISKVSRKPDPEMVVECADLLDNYALPLRKLGQLLNSAYKACYKYRLDIHYCIRKPVNNHNIPHANDSMEVVIIDQDTGRLNEGSRWQNGLHQFIEYKHNLPIKEDNLTVGALSHPAFFNSYSEIYGVTGTIGTDIERQEIADIYNLDSFDVPTHRKPIRQQYDTLICKDKEEFHRILIDEINVMLTNQRPCLILCPSIEISNNLYKLIKKPLNTTQIQLLNDVQTTDEEFIVANAGNQAMLTIATNAAGRGTDITLSSTAIKNGGLHVIFTFFPANERIEDQGAGRAARQGCPGSYRLIIPHDDEILLATQNKLMYMHDINVEQLKMYRRATIAESSQVRYNASQINLAQHKILELFCSWYQQKSLTSDFNKHLILNSWAKFYTGLEDLAWPKPSSPEGILTTNDLLGYKEVLKTQYKEFITNLNKFEEDLFYD